MVDINNYLKRFALINAQLEDCFMKIDHKDYLERFELINMQLEKELQKRARLSWLSLKLELIAVYRLAVQQKTFSVKEFEIINQRRFSGFAPILGKRGLCSLHNISQPSK